MSAKDKTDLREAIIDEALSIIETDGIEKLSMREVSRRVGVSHQAPYKHFPSRDHILAAIIQRSFEEFAAYMDARPKSDDPHRSLRAMGVAYLQYAADRPLQYRLMFGTPLPDPDQHPEMMEKAEHAFSLLRDAITHMALDAEADLDALYVLSVMHGLASIHQMQMFESLSVADHAIEERVEHVLDRIGVGLNGRTGR
jgi:AcrR family transcriptional regulator